MIFGGLLAGGKGTRMENALLPKQFLPVAGIPIFIRTLKTMLLVEKIDKVIISINAEWTDKYYEFIGKYGIDANKVVLVNGGDTRFKSLLNLVKKANEIDSSDGCKIITHDCARIFVSKEILEKSLDALDGFRVSTVSIPVIDTIIYSEDGIKESSVPDRSKLFADQGPQSFFVKEFLSLASKIPGEKIDSYIEAGKLYADNGIDVAIVKGDRMNFKITNEFDMKYAEFLIKEGYCK